jgi:hypothetical protein
MELTSPGVRPPLEWARVVATADQFDAFSNDLRDDMETRIAAAVAAEREACAKLVEGYDLVIEDVVRGKFMKFDTKPVAEVIRTRRTP